MDKYEIQHDGEKWKLQREGGNRALRSADTKADIMKSGTEYMRDHGGSLKVRGQNGQYQEERTYPRSSDPKRSKG